MHFEVCCAHVVEGRGLYAQREELLYCIYRNRLLTKYKIHVQYIVLSLFKDNILWFIFIILQPGSFKALLPSSHHASLWTGILVPIPSYNQCCRYSFIVMSLFRSDTLFEIYQWLLLITVKVLWSLLLIINMFLHVPPPAKTFGGIISVVQSISVPTPESLPSPERSGHIEAPEITCRWKPFGYSKYKCTYAYMYLAWQCSGGHWRTLSLIHHFSSIPLLIPMYSHESLQGLMQRRRRGFEKWGALN
jgi:hypothetical protein